MCWTSVDHVGVVHLVIVEVELVNLLMRMICY